MLGSCLVLRSLGNSFQDWSIVHPLKVYKMGCNEHLIGKSNCHADNQRDAVCRKGLPVNIQMSLQKLNPQQEEGKFFGVPMKAFLIEGSTARV